MPLIIEACGQAVNSFRKYITTAMDGRLSIAKPTEQVLFWALFLILTTITLYPFWNFRYPSMADYPNHLARIHIITDFAHDSWKLHYKVHYELVPNLAMDIFVPLVMKLGLNAESGLKLFAAIAFVLPVLGTIALARQINKTVPWVTLFALPLAMGRYYMWGFMNYFFSLGLALLLFAYWLRIRPSDSTAEVGGNKKRLLPAEMELFLLSAGIFCLLASHMVGFVLFLIAVFSYESHKLLNRTTGQLIGISKIGAAVLPSLIGYLLFFHRSPYGLRVIYYEFFFGKFAGVASSVFSYLVLPAVISLVIIVAAFFLIIFYTRTRIAISNSFMLPLATLLLVFLASPAAMMGSAFLDRRLFVFICLFALATVKINYSKTSASAIAVAAIALVIVKTAEVSSIWKTANNELSAVRKELLSIAPGAKLVQHPILPNGGRDDLAALRHASAFAVIDRGAFIPSMFAQPFNGESIAYIEPLDPSFKYDDGRLLRNQSELQWLRTCSGYDYVLLTGILKNISYPSCVRKMAGGNNYVLLKVVSK